MLDDVMTVHQIASELGSSYITAYRFALASLGEPVARVGTARLYTRSKATPVIHEHRARRKA